MPSWPTTTGLTRPAGFRTAGGSVIPITGTVRGGGTTGASPSQPLNRGDRISGGSVDGEDEKTDFDDDDDGLEGGSVQDPTATGREHSHTSMHGPVRGIRSTPV